MSRSFSILRDANIDSLSTVKTSISPYSTIVDTRLISSEASSGSVSSGSFQMIFTQPPAGWNEIRVRAGKFTCSAGSQTFFVNFYVPIALNGGSTSFALPFNVSEEEASNPPYYSLNIYTFDGITPNEQARGFAILGNEDGQSFITVTVHDFPNPGNPIRLEFVVSGTASIRK